MPQLVNVLLWGFPLTWTGAVSAPAGMAAMKSLREGARIVLRYLCRFLSRLSVSVISARLRQDAAQEDWMCAEIAEESVS
jgi:hypothetical protein